MTDDQAPHDSSTEAQPLLAPGALVDHYQVIRLLGRGGMGEVYLARDRSLGRRVALKIVTTEALAHAEARERFLREAQITARFSHPHIITVYGVGQVGEMPYVALEYLEGQNLADRLEEERPGARQGLRLALAIAEALAEAHRHQVLHRDLKPENVFIPRDGRLRVLDFGLAKRLCTEGAGDLNGEITIGPSPEGEGAGRAVYGSPAPEPGNLFQTRAAGIQGTPHYMSPEQWQMLAGPEADIWALGLILHELFSGEHPFAHLDLNGLWRAALNDQPVRSLAAAAQGLSPDLVSLADRCLEKAPEKRPTATEMVKTLQDLLHASEGRPAATESPFRGLLPFHERHAHQFFGREDEVEAFVERLRDVPVLPVVGPSGAGKSSFVQAGVIPRLREHGRWLVLRMRPGPTPFAALASRLAHTDSDSLRLSDFSGELSFPVPRVGSLEVFAGPIAGPKAASPDAGRRLPNTVPDAGELLVGNRSKLVQAETMILGRDKSGSPREHPLDPGETAMPDVSTAPTVLQQMPPGPSLASAPLVAPREPSSATALLVAPREPSSATAPVVAAREEPSSATAPVVAAREEPSSARPFASVLPGQLAADLAESPNRLALTLLEIAERERCRVLLLVDQLEELYTLVPEDHTRRAFMRALSTAADDPAGPVRVVFTLRDDFLWRLAEGAEAREVLGRVFVLRPPDAESLVATITRPLEAVGYSYEDEALPSEMVAEVSEESAALPLLQFAAQQLWLKRDTEGHRLTRSAYRAVGGVAGALAKHADHTLDAFTPEQLGVARQLLLRLVTAEGTRRLLGRSAALADLGPEGEGVLERLTFDRILLPRKGQREPELELVHESLVRTWSRLARWLDESREDRAFLEEALQAATLWHQRGRPVHEVWRGAALADALRQAGRSPSVPELVRDFLGEGRRLERRRLRLRRAWLASAVAVLALVALGAILFSVALGRKERETRRQRDRAGEERSEALRQRAEADRRRTEALREGARSALARTELIEARAKLRGSFQEGDSVVGRALWWQISRSPLLWRLRLNAHLYGVAYSPDGQTIAVASTAHTVHLVHRHTGETRVLRGHRDQVYGLAFSPDGRHLASGAWSGEVMLWDLARGVGRLLSKGGEGGGWGLAFSRDGVLLASGGASKEVRLLEIPSGKLQATLKGHTASVYTVAFGPDGRTLATGSTDRTIHLWDLRSGQRRATLRGHTDRVTRVAFSPDGLLLASASTDHSVRLWSLATHVQKALLTGHRAAVFGLAFRPDGRVLASAGHDQVIRLWHLPEGTPFGLLQGHQARLWDLAFSPDGKTLATASADQELRLWRVADSPLPEAHAGHSALTMGVAYSPDGSLVASASQDNTVRLWDAQEGSVRAVLEGHTAPVHGVAYHPQGRWIASAGDDRTVRIWDPSTLRTAHVLRGHAGPVHGVTFSPTGTLVASASADRTVRLWDADRGAPVRTLTGHTAAVVSASFHPDGRTLATASVDGTLRLWDVGTGRSLRRLTGHTAEVMGVVFGPDGRWLASASGDGTLRRWDPRSGESEVLGRHPGRAYLVAVDPLGQRLATTAADGVARIWDRGAQTARELWGHRGEVNAVAFSPDGKRLVTTGDDTTLRLWSAHTGAPVWRTPLLVENPPELCTHLGWLPLGVSQDPTRRAPAPSTAPNSAPSTDSDSAPSTDSATTPRITPAPEAIGSRWRTAVQKRAVLAAASTSDSALCLVTTTGDLEHWDRQMDRQMDRQTDRQTDRQRSFRPTRLGRVSRLLHQGSGCVTLVDGLLVRHKPSGRETVLGHGVQAVATDGDGLLIVEGKRLRVLDAKDQVRESLPIGSGVTAVVRMGSRFVVGYKDGGLELLGTGEGAPSFSSFEGTLASPVVRLIPGPRGTLVAGYGNGNVGLWSLRAGARLVHAKLHGSIQHLRLLGSHLVIASELGQHRKLDLSIFQQPYCDLLRTLWREIPILWQGGLPRLAEPPANHRCAIGPAP